MGQDRVYSKVRIAIFTNNYRPRSSGVPISIETFSEEFKRLGHKVFIFAPRYPNYNEYEEDVFRLRSIPAFYDKTLALPIPYPGELSAIFKDLDIDIIHTHHPFILGQFGARLAYKFKIPLVFTYHTLYEEYAHYLPFREGIVRRMAVYLATSYANRCNLVITPTDAIKELLQRNGVKTRIEKVATGIDLTRFNRADKEAIRRRFNIPRETKILLYVGRLTKEKNLVFLIEAFSLIKKRLPLSILIMVGGGPLYKRLNSLSKALKIKDYVIFSGARPREEVYPYYLAADLFLFTSLTETQGLVLYESLACGTPVVAIKTGVTLEVITDSVNGYLVPQSLEEFSKVAIDLLLDSRRLKSLKIKARESVREFSSTKQAMKMLSLYEELKRR